MRASQQGGRLAEQLGFSSTERSHVVTAISEVAGNIWLYAGRGTVELAAADDAHRIGLTVVARDEGPGIADVDQALRDGYSTRGGMGLGLPGARRLMDDFSLTSEPGRGTTVWMVRWRPKPGATVPKPPLVEWGTPPESRPGERALLLPFRHGALVAAVAGVGPPVDAHAAAEEARVVLEADAGASPIELAQRCHERLQGGGAAALALASVSGLDARMTWLALGGLEARLARGAPDRAQIREAAPALRGLPGRHLPSLRASTVIVMRSDTLTLTSRGRVLGEARFLRGAGERAPPAAR